METIINYIARMSFVQKAVLVIGLILFTPIVGVVFTLAFGGVQLLSAWVSLLLNIVFAMVGFLFSMLNWKGVLFLVIVGLVIGARAAYIYIMNSDVDGEVNDDNNSWDPFL